MSPRARVLSLTALAAGVAVAVAIGVAVGQRGPSGIAPDPAERLPKGAPPLALDLGVRQDPEAVALRRAAAIYGRSLELEEGSLARAQRLRAQAETLFARHDSLEARIGRAFAAWPDRTAERMERLGGLHARSAIVQLHLGIARIWVGHAGSEDALHDAVELAPDTQVAVTAGNLLYPDYLRDIPRFVPSAPAPASIGGLGSAGQVAALERLWRRG
ncbi:MAG: hypothetical protein FJW96_07485, partial [Actinobacteria bacterium]|nr:hypothetical protein [Actinomycetota bacterium]